MPIRHGNLRLFDRFRRAAGLRVRPAAGRQVYCCLLTLILLIVRTAGAHAHLCNDGKEPPVAIHLADGSEHPCEVSGSSEHAGDKDVQIATDVVLKKPPAADPWIATAFPVLLELVDAHAEQGISLETCDLLVESPFFLRPPLRGPPA